MVPFVINFKSIRGDVDFFSILLKTIRDVIEIARNTNNILILEYVIPETELTYF